VAAAPPTKLSLIGSPRRLITLHCLSVMASLPARCASWGQIIPNAAVVSGGQLTLIRRGLASSALGSTKVRTPSFISALILP
jgi:hypothetical protein